MRYMSVNEIGNCQHFPKSPFPKHFKNKMHAWKPKLAWILVIHCAAAHVNDKSGKVRHCLTGNLFTGSFRNWMRKRSPSKCCKLRVSAGTISTGRMGRKTAVTSGWRALTDMPTSLVTQWWKAPINNPPVRHGLRRPRPRQSQTRFSKQALRELKNWRVQGNPPTLCQPCANPSPTFRQPFTNLFCQPFLPTFSANLFCQPFLPTFSANPSPSSFFRGPQPPV